MKLVDKTNEVLNAAEDMFAKMFKEHASDMLSSLGSMDEDEMTMTFGTLKMYGAAKELAVEQARVMDQMEETIKELTKINRRMLSHIEEVNKNNSRKLDEVLKKLEEKSNNNKLKEEKKWA